MVPVPDVAPRFPVSLDLRGRHCVIVGGGDLAARKLRGLLAAGAPVRIVARTVGDTLAGVIAKAGAGAGLTLIEREFREEDLEGIWLIFTTTGTAEVDETVASAGAARRIWVNSADDPPRCSFDLPAVHRVGPITVAVSTAGLSPALGSALRDRFGVEIGPEWGVLAELIGEVRRELQAAGRRTDSIEWRPILDGPLVEMVAEGRLGEARSALVSAVGLDAT